MNPSALARPSHPETSKEAAVEIAKDLPEREARTLARVRAFPGMTASELDYNGPRVYGKRLSALLRRGLIRKGESRICTQTRFKAATWWPA